MDRIFDNVPDYAGKSGIPCLVLLLVFLKIHYSSAQTWLTSNFRVRCRGCGLRLRVTRPTAARQRMAGAQGGFRALASCAEPPPPLAGWTLDPDLKLRRPCRRRQIFTQLPAKSLPRG
jgi:hypothetical protein